MIEDLKIVRTVVEIKASFFNTLYQWIAAYECFHICSFHDFFIPFPFLVRCFSSIILVYLGEPFAFLMNFFYFFKKKKKKILMFHKS